MLIILSVLRVFSESFLSDCIGALYVFNIHRSVGPVIDLKVLLLMMHSLLGHGCIVAIIKKGFILKGAI